MLINNCRIFHLSQQLTQPPAQVSVIRALKPAPQSNYHVHWGIFRNNPSEFLTNHTLNMVPRMRLRLYPLAHHQTKSRAVAHSLSTMDNKPAIANAWRAK